MITKILLRVALFTFASGALLAAPDKIQERISRIEEGLRAAVIVKGSPHSQMKLLERMAHYHVPGVSIALINNGAIEWTRGYGVVEAGGGQPVTPGTLFQAASISKPVAAMGLLSLVEKGMLNLNEDVNLKLKSWKVPENEFTKEKRVTLRGLLNHSAGMTVHGFRGYAADEKVPSLLEVLDGRKPPANSAPVRVDSPPGSKWRYSGGGFTVAQQLVLDVTGQPFPQFMKANVLDRIRMKESTYEQPLPKDRKARAAAGHDNNGEIVKGRYRTYPEMAAAGLWTTPSDLARFGIEIQNSLFGKSNKVLSKEMTAEMLKPIMADYGLGIVARGEGGAASFSHGGSNDGFRCLMFAYRETGRGAVVMTNGERGAFLTDEIMRSIAAEYGWPDYQVPQREVANVDAKIYESYTGDYQTKRSTYKVSVEGGRLVIKAPLLGPDALQLLPETETKFFVTVDDLIFTFVKDDSGKATTMTIQPRDGEVVPAMRTK